LSGLVGKTIAFEGPDSTSGFMLPLAHLRQMGFETSEQPTPESAVKANEIGYVFAGDDDVVATWVLEGRVIAGAVDNPTFEEFDAENPGTLAVVLVRNDMDPTIAAAIKATLLGMKDTEEGQAVLRETKTKSFGEFLQEVAAEWDKTREQYLMIQD
jgi:ABC-type phosphate/phosphonate transport system substrate-binding protein